MSTSSIDPDSVLYIRDSVTSSEVYLIGTAHISDKSADDVADLIELVRPDFVFLELCPKREQKLREMMGKSSALANRHITRNIFRWHSYVSLPEKQHF